MILLLDVYGGINEVIFATARVVSPVWRTRRFSVEGPAVEINYSSQQDGCIKAVWKASISREIRTIFAWNSFYLEDYMKWQVKRGFRSTIWEENSGRNSCYGRTAVSVEIRMNPAEMLTTASPSDGVYAAIHSSSDRVAEPYAYVAMTSTQSLKRFFFCFVLLNDSVYMRNNKSRLIERSKSRERGWACESPISKRGNEGVCAPMARMRTYVIPWYYFWFWYLKWAKLLFYV